MLGVTRKLNRACNEWMVKNRPFNVSLPYASFYITCSKRMVCTVPRFSIKKVNVMFGCLKFCANFACNDKLLSLYRFILHFVSEMHTWENSRKRLSRLRLAKFLDIILRLALTYTTYTVCHIAILANAFIYC